MACKMFGRDSEGDMQLICEIDGAYTLPVVEEAEIDVEVNDLCVRPGDRVFMGKIGNARNNHEAFWVIDANGDYFTFNRFHHLRQWLADNSTLMAA